MLELSFIETLQSDIIDHYDVSIFKDRVPVRLRELACLVKEIQKLQCIACSIKGIGVHYSFRETFGVCVFLIISLQGCPSTECPYFGFAQSGNLKPGI